MKRLSADPADVSIVITPVTVDFAWPDVRTIRAILLGESKDWIELAICAPSRGARHTLSIGIVIAGAWSRLSVFIQAVAIISRIRRSGAEDGCACQSQYGQKCIAHEMFSRLDRGSQRKPAVRNMVPFGPGFKSILVEAAGRPC